MLRRRGVPVLWGRFKRRYVLLAGLAAFWLLLFGGNLFIWEFRVSGNSTVPTETVLRALENYGITIGSPGDFPFYPVPALILLAEDETGTVYGLIGSCDETALVGFVTLEDMTGTIEALVFPKVLERVSTELTPDWQRALREGLPLPGPVFSPERQQLASLLSLHWEEMTAGRLGWREPPGFQLYASRQQAAEQWRFTDDDFWKRG